MMNKIFIVLLFICIGNKLYAQNDKATCVTTSTLNPILTFGNAPAGVTNGVASDMWQQYYIYGEYSWKLPTNTGNPLNATDIKFVHSTRELGLELADNYIYSRATTTTANNAGGKPGQTVPANYYKPCPNTIFNPTSIPTTSSTIPTTNIPGDNIGVVNTNVAQWTNQFNLPTFNNKEQTAHLSVVYTLKRNFIPGFYRITIGSNHEYLKMILLYSNSTPAAPNISLNDAKYNNLHTTVLGTPPWVSPSISPSTSPVGLDGGRLRYPKLNSSFTDTETNTKIVYLSKEHNFLLSVSGYLMDKDQTLRVNNSQPIPNFIRFSIEPLSSPEQVCTEYIAKPELNTTACNLTNITFDVLDGDANYLFFYRNTTNEPYKILPNLLIAKNKKIKALNIPYDITTKKILEWGVIRSDDGCTFMATTPITNIPVNRVTISNIIPSPPPPPQLPYPQICGEQLGKLELTITENAPSTDIYEVFAYVTPPPSSTATFLKWNVTGKFISGSTTTKKLEITDVPLGYTFNSFVVKGIGHPCASLPLSSSIIFNELTYTLGGTIALQSLGTCGQKLTFTPTTSYSCAVFEWYYSTDAANSQPFTYITTGQELAVSRPGDYQVKHIVDGKSIMSQIFAINASNLIPTISLNAINITPVPDLLNINSTSTSDVLEAGDGFNADMLITQNLLPACPTVAWSITPSTPIIIVPPTTCTNGIAKITANIPNTTNAVGVYTLKATVTSTVNPACTYEVTKVIRVKPKPFSGDLKAAITAPTNIYGLTQTSLDESYFVNHNKNILYFAYKGDYQAGNPTVSGAASTTPNKNPLKAIIYDWERKVIGTFTVPTTLPYNKQYGSTWYEVQLPTTNPLGRGQYILELYDENEWLRKMRFNVIPSGDGGCDIANGCEQGRKYFEVKNIKSSDRPPYRVEWVCTESDGNSFNIPFRTINTNSDRAYFNDFASYLNNFNMGNNIEISVTVKDICGNIICAKNLGEFLDSDPCLGQPSNEGTPKFQLFFNVIPQATPTTPTIKH